jgi:threonine aldolase
MSAVPMEAVARAQRATRSFTSDNRAGGAPEVIAAVAAAASGQTPPNGTDSCTLGARRRVSEIDGRQSEVADMGCG